MLEALERAQYEIKVVLEDGLEPRKLPNAASRAREILTDIEHLRAICERADP
jgi:hypothetical protein